MNFDNKTGSNITNLFYDPNFVPTTGRKSVEEVTITPTLPSINILHILLNKVFSLFKYLNAAFSSIY